MSLRLTSRLVRSLGGRWFARVNLIVLLGAASARAELKTAREFLRNNQPEKAAAEVEAMLGTRSNDPWLRYNAGVAAYAARDFAKADAIWEELAGTELPRKLRDHVWTQIGNVSFRQVQGTLAREPDLALGKLEQSREAFRVALAHNKRNRIATQNLAFVEKELEKLYALLAQRLIGEARKERQNEKAIEKLQAALAHQENAAALNPQSEEHQQVKKEVEKELGERFVTKAEESEKEADKRQQNTKWERDEAQKQLEKALADFEQAQSYDAENEPAQKGEARVKEKLANTLAKEGRENQAEGQQMAQNNPQTALDKFDSALESFDQALAMQPDHADAKQGREEVRNAMEKLHLEQGDQLAQRAEQQAKQNQTAAAENMLGALEHFEMAQDLDPDDQEIQARIDRAQSRLPEMLMAMARQEQQRAQQVEPTSPESAVSHLERAETALDKTAQLAPSNEDAGQLRQQVETDLNRLRRQLAQQAAQRQQKQQAQQQTPKGQEQPSEQEQQSFQAMLAQVKARQEQNEMNARHMGAQRYDPKKEQAFRNW